VHTHVNPHSKKKQLERWGHQQGYDGNDDADDTQSRLLLGNRDDPQQDPQGSEKERNKKDADDAANDAAYSKSAALPLPLVRAEADEVAALRAVLDASGLL